MKLAQRSFEIDTSKPNHINLAPKYMALEGVIRFESELFVDEVGLRVNGQEFTEFENMDEIDLQLLY